MSKVKTKVKICGLTRKEDTKFINRLQPDYVGFVFAPSRRQVAKSLALAMRERLNRSIIPVGVFVDEPIKNIIELYDFGIIDVAQLHGNENRDYITELRSREAMPIIKAVKPGQALEDYDLADFLLFDSPIPGSGNTFDWSKLPKTGKPFFLAGGLNPDNVAEAIRQTAPYAVDVSSGVEVDGIKDEAKIAKFMENAKQ